VSSAHTFLVETTSTNFSRSYILQVLRVGLKIASQVHGRLSVVACREKTFSRVYRVLIAETELLLLNSSLTIVLLLLIELWK
jgi:hypothetical protein